MGGASSNRPILCDLMKSIGMFAHYAMACNCDVQKSPRGLTCKVSSPMLNYFQSNFLSKTIYCIISFKGSATIYQLLFEGQLKVKTIEVKFDVYIS